jgi:hypothetical protein
MNTVLSTEAIKKALFDSYEEAQDYDEKGELFPEKHVARKQDTFTKSEYAKAVREMIKNNPYKYLNYETTKNAYTEALQAVLKLIEGKE